MNKFLEGNYASIFEEDEFKNITDITGEIPKELNGDLFRNGPNPQFPNDKTHWFEGDGMLHMFSIYDGKMDYCNRWIVTERFQIERQAGKALFTDFAPEIKEEYNLAEMPHNTANTNIIRHGNKLLALQETSPATEMNPKDLSTIGIWDYNGHVPQTSAHPHFDYETGEMHNFAYNPSSTEIIYYIFDKFGKVIKAEKFNGPFSCFMHDFFITKNYALFLFLPLSINFDRAQQGMSLIMWEPD